MTYPTKLNDRMEQTLAPILPELQALNDGDSCTVSDTAERMKFVRYCLYSWRHINNLKEVFKMYQETPECIRVVRRAIPRPTVQTNRSASKIEQLVMDNLLTCTREDEAQEFLRKKVEAEELTLDEAMAARDLWRRKCGG